jgi:hypothetical protein
LVKSVHLEQNVLAWNKTFLPETKCSCLPHTTSRGVRAFSLRDKNNEHYCMMFVHYKIPNLDSSLPS